MITYCGIDVGGERRGSILCRLSVDKGAARAMFAKLRGDLDPLVHYHLVEGLLTGPIVGVAVDAPSGASFRLPEPGARGAKGVRWTERFVDANPQWSPHYTNPSHTIPSWICIGWRIYELLIGDPEGERVPAGLLVDLPRRLRSHESFDVIEYFPSDLYNRVAGESGLRDAFLQHLAWVTRPLIGEDGKVLATGDIVLRRLDGCFRRGQAAKRRDRAQDLADALAGALLVQFLHARPEALLRVGFGQPNSVDWCQPGYSLDDHEGWIVSVQYRTTE